MIAQYCTEFFSEVKQSIAMFRWNTPQTVNAVRTALAIIFAIILALWLQADQPFWSAISAMIVMQPFVGNTVDKSLHRFVGTTIGALLGLLLASLFIQQHFIMYLMVFLLAFVGIYMGSIDLKHKYSWLLGYGTALIILFQGMANPNPDNFIHIAFFRTFEVSIGIFVGLVVSYTILPQRAMSLLKDDIIELTQSVDQLFQHFCQYIQGVDTQQGKQAFIKGIGPFRQELQRLQMLLQVSEYEHFRDQGEQLISYEQWLTLLNHISTMMLAWYRHHGSETATNNYLAELGEIWPMCLQQAERCLHSLQESLAQSEDFSRVQHEIDQFDQLWHKLESRMVQICQDSSYSLRKVERIEQTFQQLVGIKVTIFEISAFIHPDKNLLPANKCQRKISWLQRILYYDWYYVKHASLGACAILFTPLIWLFFNFPGFSQIAISIIAIIGMDIEGTRNKGILRMVGCFIGLIITVLLLGLNIQNVLMLLLVIFSVSSLFLYFYFANSSIGYFGLQSTIVFSIGIIPQLLPTTSIAPAVERMVAITLGISSIILFQHILWRFTAETRASHHLKQFKRALYPLIDAIERYFLTGDNVTMIDTQCYFKIRSILKILQSIDSPLFEPIRDFSHSLYFLFMLTRHSTQQQALMNMCPEVLILFTKLADIVSQPYPHEEVIYQALFDFHQVNQQRLKCSQRFWQYGMLSIKDVNLRFEICAILSMLRQVSYAEYRLMQQIKALPYLFT